MKFPDLNSNLFSKEEVELLNSWYEEMKKKPAGRKIIENMEKDTKVPEFIWEKFLRNLITRIKEGNGGVDALRLAIDNDMLLKGPPVNRVHLDERFSKLVKAGSLFRYLNDNIPIFRDKKNQERICKWIEDGTITIKKSFKKEKLRGRKPVVWATFTEEIEKEIMRNDDINDLCDKLGLLDFDECEYVIELRYDSNKTHNVRFPTIIEAGETPPYHPGEKEDDYGHTWDLKNRDWGLPEVVHEPIPFHDIDAMSCLGHKDKDATSLFLADKFLTTEEP